MPYDLGSSACQEATEVLHDLGTSLDAGLSAEEARRRTDEYGPNAVSSHRARLVPVLWHQVRSPLLVLLVVAAVASYFVGERSDAVIIGFIIAMSVGLGFVNEYRAEKAAEHLHSRITRRSTVLRDGLTASVDVGELVPGDVVRLSMGEVVPADLRLLEVVGLECDESVMTGESQPVTKSLDLVPAGTTLDGLTDCALMGTVVHAGDATGVVVATGARAHFGAVAAGLSTHQLDTSFQVGLRRFSMLLVYVAGALTTAIFIANLALRRPFLDALLFSLAIAVGITPQLLPAVVSTSLAAGSRRMLRLRVLVKRLVCIEDLGDIDVLLTDKTGTLTRGQIAFARTVSAGSMRSRELLLWALLCTEGSAGAVGGNPLDRALWASPATHDVRGEVDGFRRLATLPFDHQRNMVSTLVQDGTGRRHVITKGAPEAVLARCTDVPPTALEALANEFAAGNRVVALALRPSAIDTLAPHDEAGLRLVGFLVFLDPPRADAGHAIDRLTRLGVQVKVVTGDNPAVAAKVCHDLGLPVSVLTGAEIQEMDDARFAAAAAAATVFARVSPEQKARIVKAHRTKSAGGVAFLGDGVNDALALHSADVGISVDSGTDVAKDAADVILLEKDLDVLADGVAEGRRIFANTIKYVLMGTSSNFGNMFSAAGASLFLPFLPMLPSQILLNNLLYDSSQLAIPTDEVDEEQLLKPSHWDLSFIRRFMLVFGPVSSVFDFMTFGVMLWGFHASAQEFRSGWFVESLATQTLVIFAIRTRRIPFLHSRPSLPLTLAALGVVTIGAILPATPLAHALGFTPLPGAFFATLLAMVLAYLALIEIGKLWFYRSARPAVRASRPLPQRTMRRRSRYFTSTAFRHPQGRPAPTDAAHPGPAGTRPAAPATTGGG